MPDADVARAVREEATRWAVTFRRLAEEDGQCCTAAGYLAAAKLLDRSVAEPAGRGTIDLRPGRPRRSGSYVQASAAEDAKRGPA